MLVRRSSVSRVQVRSPRCYLFIPNYTNKSNLIKKLTYDRNLHKPELEIDAFITEVVSVEKGYSNRIQQFLKEFIFVQKIFHNMDSAPRNCSHLLQNASVFPTLPPDEKMEYLQFEYIIHVYLLIPLVVLGLIGNGLCYLLFSQDRSNSVIFYLLRALAISDTFVLLTWILFYTTPNLIDQHTPRSTFIEINNWAWPLARIAYTCDIWVVVVVAGERYIAVCKSEMAKKICTIPRAKQVVIAVFLASAVFHLPSWFRESSYHCLNSTETFYEKTELYESAVFQVIYSSILYSIVNIIVPMVALIYFNAKLISTVLESKRRRQGLGLEERQEDNNIRIILIVIVFVFIVCQLPMMISYIWNDVNFYIFKSKTLPLQYYYWATIGDYLSAINSSTNFLIYGIFSPRFQDLGRRFIRKYCGKCVHLHVPINGHVHTNGRSYATDML